MKRNDFIHLVHISSEAYADDSHAYRRGVAAFAALGYMWVVGCFVAAIALLTWTLVDIFAGHIHAGHGVTLIGACGLLWAHLRVLWLHFDPPDGVPIVETEAPRLFAALERIRKKVIGSPIHHVLLDDSFSVNIIQIPRFGIFGRSTNYLTVGLPLLMAVDRPRFFAAVAHEYGHLRTRHGKFSAWIYRTRSRWEKLGQGMRNKDGPLAVVTQAFLRWYVPRLLAKTFALARLDEFASDRIAAKLLGSEVTGAALTEIAVKGHWLNSTFWPLHWSAATTSSRPMGPYSAMHTLLAQPLGADFARQAVRHALIQLSVDDETHPALRERLEALQLSKHSPAWSIHPALNLLGKSSTSWITQFDKRWCSDHAAGWTIHHAHLRRLQVGIDRLTASIHRNNADEMTQLGELHRQMYGNADVRLHFERALHISPGHAGALRGLAQCMPEQEHAARLDCLDQLYELSPATRWWTCSTAVSMLEKQLAMGLLDEKALKVWRARRQQAHESETRAWTELSTPPFLKATTRHDLNDFEVSALQSVMARCKSVARAWLVRKSLRELSSRRSYLMFIELPGIHDEDRQTLCQDLQSALELPGPALVTWVGRSPTLQDIQRHAFDLVYVRQPA